MSIKWDNVNRDATEVLALASRPMNTFPFYLSFPRTGLLSALLLTLSPNITVAANSNWREALSFHASFDEGTDADFARGDRRLYHATAMNKRAEATSGLPAVSPVERVPGQGKFGAALRFKEKSPVTVFYQVATNFAYRPGNWSGAVSFWLRTDPAGELAIGYCDPVQITPRAWNDAAFFVEFEKRTNSIPFRLGVYPDLKVWNPDNRKWENMSAAEKPLLTIEKPPFAGARWTHVVFTFENFNTGRPDGIARLYLDGQPQGGIPARAQTFTWEPSAAHVMMGLGYVGMFDELSLFDRALTADEVAVLYRLPDGVRAKLK